MMALGFVFALFALSGLVAEAAPVQQLPRFPESWFEPRRVVEEQELTQEPEFSSESSNETSSTDIEEPETELFEVIETSTETSTEISTEPTTTEEVTTSVEVIVETGASEELTTVAPTAAPMTSYAYTDEFHPDPFLVAAIKAAKNPIYQRIREPPSQEYSYDFLKEM